MLKINFNERLPVTNVFENISFKNDNKDYEFEVLIPPMMIEMKFRFNCEINNSSTGEKRNMSYEQNSNFVQSNIFHVFYSQNFEIKYIYKIL